MELFPGQPFCRPAGFPQRENERERARARKSMSFYNLMSRVTSHHCLCVLFTKIKSPGGFILSCVCVCVCVCVCAHSVMSDSFMTPWIIAFQAPVYVEFSREESVQSVQSLNCV